MDAVNIWKTWHELKGIISQRKVVFFGRGEWVEKTLPRADFNAAFIVDNNKNQQGTSEHGLDVVAPEKLKELLTNRDEYYVIICTSDFFNVGEQLNGYGFTAGKEYCVTPLMINRRVLSELHEYDERILFSSSDPLSDEADRGGGVYLYDTSTLEYRKLLSGISHGFIKFEDRYYVTDDSQGVRVYDHKFENQLDLFEIPPKARPHGIAFHESTRQMYVAYSGLDYVSAFDLDSKEAVDTIPISHKCERYGAACHHMNDICIAEDSLYMSMFSKNGNWKKASFDGVILEYDLREKKMLGPAVDRLWMPHNAKMIDGHLSYCDSMRGNLHTTTYKIASHFNGFIRGLGYDGRFFLVGQSAHRYFDRMKEVSNNIAVDCGIHVFHNDTKACRFFALPKFLDIHCLDIYSD